MCREVEDEAHLVGADAVVKCTLDAVSSDLASDEVGVSTADVDKQVHDGNLERVGRVGVDLVVGLEDQKALLLVRMSRRDEWRSRRRERGGESGRVEARGVILMLVDEPEVSQVSQYVALGRREPLGRVVLRLAGHQLGRASMQPKERRTLPSSSEPSMKRNWRTSTVSGATLR